MRNTMYSLIGIFAVAFVFAFIWRVFVTVEVPVPDYTFGVVFKNTAWIAGIIEFSLKFLRWFTRN